MAETSIFVLGSFVVSCSAKVPRFPLPGESLSAEVVTIEPGGKGFNLAIAARRLGARVDGLLAVGDDIAAAFAAPALAMADLPGGMLLRLPGKTGSGVGFTDASGETCLAIDSGANRALGAGHVRDVADKVEGATLVMAQFEIGDAPIREAFSIARRSGGTTLLNPSPFRPIARDILADTTILVVNESEARALAADLGLVANPSEPFEARIAALLLDCGPALVVLTRGAAGAIAISRETTLRQAALPIAAVDALGAGDAFAAALGVCLARGGTLAEAMLQAAAAGALATRMPGVFDALPTRQMVVDLIAEQA